MLIAHLPSGYVPGRIIPSHIPYLMPAALIGAILPDTDMLFFHFVDHGSIHHHRYWVHIPLFWAAVAAVTVPVLARTRYLQTALVFFAALLLHMALDTISGGILWGVPFSNHLFSLVTVPATQSHWVLSFILHWTFLLEILIWLIAIALFVQRWRDQS